MRVRLNNRKQIKLNTGNVRTNLFNETRIKMFGTPGSVPISVCGFDYTFDFAFGVCSDEPLITTYFRLLEDNDLRITENGDFRILQ